jgi:putative endonuclease
MYFIYVLQSVKDGKYYIGQTNNLNERLLRHNSGQVTSTKNRRPFKIIYRETFENRSESIFREKQIKAMKGGNKFRELIDK